MITLKTLHTATAQEVFDQAVNHLRVQGKRSALDPLVLSESCLYRSEDGLKCAAGCFIADDEYEPEMEGKSWIHEMFPEAHRDLIQSLQTIHDHNHINKWEMKFEELAKEYNLEYTPA